MVGKSKKSKSDLFLRRRPTIGVDIGASSLKVMALDLEHAAVTGYGSIDVNPRELNKMLEGDTVKLASHLRKLLKENIVGSLPSRHAILSIPAGKTFSRSLNLPVVAEKNLTEAIHLEAEQYIPAPVESLYIDHEIVERTKKSITVLITAAPKQLVDTCVNAATSAGLLPILVEPSTNAIARTLKKAEEGHLTTAMLDFGSTTTDIAIIDKGGVRVTGSIGIGGNTLTHDISKKLGITIENAHQYKILNGLSKSPRQRKITQAVDPNLRRIVDETRKVMRFYTERVATGTKIEQLIIVGGGSNIPGIGEYFTNALLMPARVASPWQSLDFGKLPQPHRRFRPRYITVAGLASVTANDVWGKL